MDGPAAWRDLATRFLELHSGGEGQMYALWSTSGHNPAGDTWSLNGAVSPHGRQLFEWSAERGAALLGHPGGSGSLAFWLDALRGGSQRYSTSQTGGRRIEDGPIQMEDFGTIANVCFASAEYCYKLETAAIAKREPAAARIEVISANVKARAAARAYEEIEFQKKLKELREAEHQKYASGEAQPVEPQGELITDLSENDAREGQPDAVAAERAAILAAFKTKARNQGIKVTDEMVAKATNPGKWNDRTMVTRWKRNDPKCRPIHDRMIRAVLSRDPSSIWPTQRK
jgi:hypothetical protein